MKTVVVKTPTCSMCDKKVTNFVESSLYCCIIDISRRYLLSFDGFGHCFLGLKGELTSFSCSAESS